MKLIFTLLFVSLGIVVGAQEIPDWSVINHYGGDNSEGAVRIEVDAQGNNYTLMTYSYYGIAFDTITFPPPEYDKDYAVVKHNRDGKLLNATRIALKHDQVYTPWLVVRSMAVDEDENVYVCGEFSDTVIVGTLKVGHSNQISDLFVAKIDKNGNTVWLKRLEGTGRERLSDMAVDKNGDIYLTGSYYGYVTDLGSHHLVSTSGSNNMIFCKLNNSGTIQWIKYSIAGSVNPAKLVLDDNKNIVIAGTCIDAFSFDGVNYYNATGSAYLFTCKFSAAGNLLWANTPISSGYSEVYSMAANHKGDVLIIGRHQDTTLRFNSTDSLINSNFWEYFLASYSSTGTLNWAKGFGSPADLNSRLSVTADLDNNWYVGGYLSGYWVYNDTDTVAKTDKFEHSAIIKFNNSGVRQWILTTGPNTHPRDIACDNANNLYLIGGYGCDNCFTPFGDSMLPPTNYYYSDVYIAKLSAQELVKTSTPDKNTYCLGDTIKVPFENVDTVFNTGNSFRLELSNSAGTFKTSTILETKTTTNASDTFVVVLPQSLAPAGNYRLRVTSTAPAFFAWDNGSDITINALPTKPVVSVAGEDLSTNTAAGTLEWFKNGTSVGVTTSTFKPQSAGMYTVKVTNASGCSSTSDPFWFVPAGINDVNGQSDIQIYPNPVTGHAFYVIGSGPIQDIYILSIEGKQVDHIRMPYISQSGRVEVRLRKDLSEGVYILKCYTASGNTIIRKLQVK